MRSRNAFDLAVAVVNAPITLASVAVGVATGASVRLDRHFTVVCEGGWLSDVGLSSAFTSGNAVNVKRSAAERLRSSDALLEHEWRHAVQWAALGPLPFVALYALSYFGSQRFSGTQAWNVFEWTAGFADGGYSDCAGLGRVAPAAENDKTVRCEPSF